MKVLGGMTSRQYVKIGGKMKDKLPESFIFFKEDASE
jgi:hypothetical protein